MNQPGWFLGRGRPGFTLIEILVSTGIICLLGALVLAAGGAAVKRQEITAEVAAARQLLAAYHSYAADHNGSLLTGYWVGGEAVARSGETFASTSANRYVWRLAPYLNYEMHGTFYVNAMRKRLPHPHDSAVRYEASISPSLGLNTHCLGGYSNDDWGTGVIKRQSQIEGGGNLVVFASAARIVEGDLREGNHEVSPPTARGKAWVSEDKVVPGQPGLTGSVHFRYEGRAVIAHYAGHVTLESQRELRDMRLWNLAALQANDPEFPLPRYR